MSGKQRRGGNALHDGPPAPGMPVPAWLEASLHKILSLSLDHATIVSVHHDQALPACSTLATSPKWCSADEATLVPRTLLISNIRGLRNTLSTAAYRYITISM
ncbi:hypothetical protein E2C01_064819 [Portunus trituberculatus]|uniref:Uncharacterized protein n=1 Tax=Portunus trituberculatus TaxID=210409 RepID=A0A5B7HMX1_PORTR|nr:hypothetical protein [Portunus trituberculatus]